jgi:pyruvate dehydrogenase kinase 2/3/4
VASHATIGRWKSRPATPKRFSDLCSIGNDKIWYSNWLREEMCIRLAQSASLLQSLPHGWADRAPFHEIISLHDSSIEALEDCTPPESPEEDKNFAEVLDQAFESLSAVAKTQVILQGLEELSTELDNEINSIPFEVNGLLTDFLTLRNSMGILIQLHQEWRESGKKKSSLILERNCRASQVAKTAAKGSFKICQATLGKAPKIMVQGDLHKMLTCVPVILQYMLTEILKNSCRAVVERHQASGKILPPIIIAIEAGADDVTIKVTDEGCGISQDKVDRIWDFLYTTCEKSPWTNSKAKQASQLRTGVLAGYGVGLPLTRMYARYFGGDVVASSQEGMGTQVSIRLGSSPDVREALPSRFWLDPANIPIIDREPFTVAVGAGL